MLIMVEKGMRDGMCHAICGYGRASSNYIKDYDSNKESSYLMYWNGNFLYANIEISLRQCNKISLCMVLNAYVTCLCQIKNP